MPRVVRESGERLGDFYHKLVIGWFGGSDEAEIVGEPDHVTLLQDKSTRTKRMSGGRTGKGTHPQLENKW
jgi:hypothetical protein